MLSRYWKAIIAFLFLLSTALSGIISNPDIAAVLPPQVGAWLSAAGVVVGTWLVWLKRNQHNVEDLERIADENGLSLRPKTTDLP
jgi:D-serine deaminase-like pyridoxal phosphate-dependent protein